MKRKYHGMSKTPIYKNWAAMKDRCFNPNHKHYKHYGGRGITVCDEWKDDFMAFYGYVSRLEHFGEPGYSLDRIDNNGNYEPGNVRWATRKEQLRNMRNNHFVDVGGEQMIMADAAKEAGVGFNTICGRIQHGWAGEELLKPAQKNAKGIDDSQSKIKSEADIIYIRNNPDDLTQEELAERFGVCQATIGAIQRGERYRNAGGTIREPIPQAKRRHPHYKISAEQRAEIRRLYATGKYTQQQLADMFGCDQTLISIIIHETD